MASLDEEARRNRQVTDCLEPGSTFKIFIAASALDAQVVKPTDKFHCENGVWHLGAKEVIHDVHPYGTLTVQQVIQKSSNIGAAKIAHKVGPDPPGSISPGFRLRPPHRHPLPRGDRRIREKSSPDPFPH